MRVLAEVETTTIEPSDKVGYDFRIVKLGDNEVYREYIPNAKHKADKEETTTASGDYLNPIPFTDGMEVTEGLFYIFADENIWECIKSGNAEYTTEWFDIVE